MDRWYLRINAAVGPRYYIGEFGCAMAWVQDRDEAVEFDAASAARAYRATLGLPASVVRGLWCNDSPVHEHAWQWRDGGLVCAHCGGRRVEAKA